MGPRHDRDSLLAAAVEAVREDGLANLTFGRLGRRLGIPDRTVVYYFPTKERLVAEALEQISAGLAGQLARAFGDRPRSARELISRAWPVLCTPDAETSFRVFFELTGLAAAGAEPYRAIAGGFFERWHAWLTTLIDRPRVDQRRADAAAVMAQVDGLMMLRLLCDPVLADRAYRRIAG